MEQNEDDPPPFWMQSNTTLRQVDRHRRRNRQATSLFFNTGVLVVFLLVTAVLFLVIVIPSVLSLARQVFNPSLVKSSWSSLNIVLVLFAIVCGFLGRKENEDTTPVNTPMRRQQQQQQQEAVEKSEFLQDSPRDQWYNQYQNSFGNVDTIRRLRRNSMSYPDLRQDSMTQENNPRWRFYDDTDVENYPYQRSDSQISRSRSLDGVTEDQGVVIKNIIEVDKKNDGEQELSHVVEATSASSSSVSPSVVDDDESVASSPGVDVQEKIENGSKEVVDDDEKSIGNKNVDVVDGFVSDAISVVGDDQTPKSVPMVQPSSYIPPLSPEVFSFLPPPSPTSYFWPPPSPPPPPPPPPPPRRVHPTIPTKKKVQQTFETVGYERYRWNNMDTRTTNNNNNHNNINNHPSLRKHSKTKVEVPTPSPPPAPPQQPPRARPIQRDYSAESSDKKKSGGVTKEFFTSFYQQSKSKRKHKRRSFENLEDFIEPPQASIYRSQSTPEFPPLSPPPSTPPPPPPPPPPNPHSVFHNLFSKKGKSKKKVHSVSATTNHPPPPPPPPPVKSKFTPPPPPPPTKKSIKKTVSFSSDDQHYPSASKTHAHSSASAIKEGQMYATLYDQEVHIRGNKNPSLVPPPPPTPPPPPFKMKSPWTYVLQGDFVKLESNNNSPRSGYSASDDESGSPSSVQKSPTGGSPGPLFMPSPDVNTKADDFIAMFRAKLKLEKLDSIKLKGAGPSRLGPDSSSAHS